MVPMPIVRLTLKSDITKLEVGFFNAYCDDNRVFYISAIDSKGYFEFIDDEVRASWCPNWTQVNVMFESQLDTNLAFISYKNKFFLYGMVITNF
jgi:hypothetical protein